MNKENYIEIKSIRDDLRSKNWDILTKNGFDPDYLLENELKVENNLTISEKNDVVEENPKNPQSNHENNIQTI